jgi:hypothetical protein
VTGAGFSLQTSLVGLQLRLLQRLALPNANAANSSTGEASKNPLSRANLWSRIKKKWLLAAPSGHLPSLSSEGAAGESESRGGEGADGGSEARG